MRAARFSGIINRYVADGEMTEEDAVRLMIAAPDRIHTLMPGLILADVLLKELGSEEIVYSDSGVREGYLYSELLREK